jgi:hypothetical protein
LAAPSGQVAAVATAGGGDAVVDGAAVVDAAVVGAAVVAGSVLLVAGDEDAPLELQLETVSTATTATRGMIDLQDIRGSVSLVDGATVVRDGFRSTSNRLAALQDGCSGR